ncbi:MAG TPA: MBL fold metallo-hydrolase [Planctomycetota bacterium]|nr:MBL fold metallo-hydrolase [Planctomycetota bacterium]
MRIRFLGAAQTVTGSMHLVEVNNRRVLLDCGLYQGHREEAYRRNSELPFHGSHIDAVVLSHAHIDHSGSLPTLVKNGFRGRIYATRATADLAGIMLEDSASIQLRDHEYLVKKGRDSQGPLYLPEHARAAIKRFRGEDYHAWFDVAEGVRARFQDAGHILGSATVHLEITEPGTGKKRITFTGDLGRKGIPLLRDPEPLPEAEVVITESTYGGREHDHGHGSGVASQMKAALKLAVDEAHARGGKLIIPAFSVGRTQNILYFLNELMHEGSIQTTTIFVDSPLSVESTEVLKRHPECFDAATLAKLGANLEPLIGPHVELTREVEDSKRINHFKGTCVVISASGMCEFGRILHHLANNLEDKRAVVAFVGYQAHNTLGRRILEGAEQVRIYGENVSVRAKIVKLNGFSAHADHSELMDALSPLKSSAGHTFVVHGEPDAANALANDLISKGFASVDVPADGSEYTV